MQKNLATRLCKLSGMTNAFFCNSGAESVETAIKIARKYGNDHNISTPKILVMENSACVPPKSAQSHSVVRTLVFHPDISSHLANAGNMSL